MSVRSIIILVVISCLVSCKSYYTQIPSTPIKIAALGEDNFVKIRNLSAEITITKYFGFIKVPRISTGAIHMERFIIKRKKGKPVQKLEEGEAYAVYTLINQHPELDFIVNPNFTRTVTSTFFSEVTTVTCHATGARIRTDSEREPDKDFDGVFDFEDECPETFGLRQFKGCPADSTADTDKDGIVDFRDDCPDVAGLKKYSGCPDSDGDGIIDKKDNCPEIVGTWENQGCPEIVVKAPETKMEITRDIKKVELKKEEKEVLKTAFNNLEFEFGTATITVESIPSLEILANLILKNPEYKLYAAGHTDNVGSKKANLKLSQNRADAVKNFLINKGIKPENIITVAYGEKYPVGSNETEGGRAKNRRVELIIIQ
ncbi:OmpA family protein [Cytophagaceae bacterium AH-315-L13]|nr:OmpA family protein [Cytophagaceae bacterium AH-315-L13]